MTGTPEASLARRHRRDNVVITDDREPIEFLDEMDDRIERDTALGIPTAAFTAASSVRR